VYNNSEPSAAFRPRPASPPLSYGPETRQNPQPIVGNERFDEITPVDAIDSTGSRGNNDDPPEDDPEERFGDPVKYFADLERLEADIVGHSSLEIYKSNKAIGDLEINVHLPNPTTLETIALPSSEEESLERCETMSKFGSTTALYATTMVHLLRCRNIMFAVYDNCCKLTEAEFGGELINCLTIMQGRENVAELISIEASSIKSIAQEFDSTVSKYRSQVINPEGGFPDPSEAKNVLKGINDRCKDCLHGLGLWDQSMEKKEPEYHWYCTAQVLDLAVVSFAGAHSQDFSCYLGREAFSFIIPAPYMQLPPLFTLRKRHLRCLDNFFGGNPIWIFHPYSLAATPDEPLYLSTNMRDFSHIWGPVWGIPTSKTLEGGVKRWDVGGGSIYPWPIPEGGPKPTNGEIFCHWLPAAKSRGGVDSSKTLSVADSLLIGALVSLEPHDNCQRTAAEVEQRLRDLNALHDLRTSESSYYVDSTSGAISLVGWGFNISGSKTFKRRNGQTLKSALLDRWSHDRDGRRMIQDLEKGYGLEMSFCSLNAKRTRLFDLLRTDNMIKYLEDFDWDDRSCENRFLCVLREDGTVQDLLAMYKDNQKWRKDIRDATILSLRILAECCVSEATSELSIPWISTSGYSVILSRREISWNGFFKTRETPRPLGSWWKNACLLTRREGELVANTRESQCCKL
jgi:hypothetical protein